MEVEVDPETGDVEVTNMSSCNDVGKAVDHDSCEAGSWGGTIMATSRGRLEEAIWDPQTGVMLNGNLIDYKLATMLDCGSITPNIIETGLGYGPYGAAGLYEPTGT